MFMLCVGRGREIVAATVGATGGPSASAMNAMNAMKGGNGRPFVNEWGKVRRRTSIDASARAYRDVISSPRSSGADESPCFVCICY